MAISSGGIDLAGKDYNIDPLIQKVGALADRMDQALDGSEKLGKSLKKITNSKIKLQADFSDAEKANSILDDLYKKSQTKAIIEIETVDENGDKVKTKKVNPDHVSRVGQLEKYFKSQESAKNSMVGHWNELVQQVNENESLSISDLIKSNNKDSTTVLRYANAFEALGGDIRSVSNDLADFVDKMRELPNLQEESGNAFTVRNFKETFKYFQQLKDEAGAVFQEYNSNEAPVNIEAFKRASQAARQAADESEESSKRERDASEEAAEAAEESAKRQKAAYESVEEIKRRVGANYPKRDTREVYEDKHYNRKALNNLDDLDDIYEYGMPDEKEINKLRDIIQALQKHRRETLDEFDSYAQYYQDAINEGNDARVKNYSEYLEYDYKQLLEDVDMLDYVNKVLEQKIQEAEKLNNELEKVREKAREEYRESPWSIESDQMYNESTDDEDLWIDKNAESRLKNLQGIYGKLKDLSQEIQAEIDKSSAAFKEALYEGRDTSSYEQDLSANYQILEKYGDQMNYINSQIKAESESFTPGETWGADEIANLIQLLQNLYEEIQKITGAVSGIDTTVDLSSISDSIEQIAKALGVVDEEMDVRPLLEQFRDVGAVIDDAFGIDSLQEFKGSLQEIADILNIISLSNGVIGDGTSKAAKADQMSQRQRLQAIQAKLGKNQFNVHVKEDDSLDTQQRIAQEKEMWNTARKGYMGTYNKLKDVAKKYLIGYENNETALLSSILSNKSVGEKITNAGIDIFKEYGSAPIGLIKDDEEAVKRLQKLVGLLKEVALNEQKTVRWDTLSQLKDDMAEAGELTEEAREKINKLLNDIDSTKSSKDLVKIDDKLLSQYGLQFQDRYWEEIANTLKGAYSSDTMDSLSSKRREIYDIKRNNGGRTLKDTLLEALQNAGMSNDGEGDYSELITRITEAIAGLQNVIKQGLGIKEEGSDDKVFLEELIKTIRALNDLLSTNQNAGNSILGLSPDNIEAITTSFKTLEKILSHIQDLVASIKFPELSNVKVKSEQENTDESQKQTFRTTKTKKTVRRKIASGGEVTTEHESSSGESQGGSSTGVSHTGDLARVDGELKDVIRDAGEAADSVAQVGKVSAPAGQTIGEKIADGLNEAAEAAEKVYEPVERIMNLSWFNQSGHMGKMTIDLERFFPANQSDLKTLIDTINKGESADIDKNLDQLNQFINNRRKQLRRLLSDEELDTDNSLLDKEAINNYGKLTKNQRQAMLDKYNAYSKVLYESLSKNIKVPTEIKDIKGEFGLQVKEGVLDALEAVELLRQKIHEFYNQSQVSQDITDEVISSERKQEEQAERTAEAETKRAEATREANAVPVEQPAEGQKPAETTASPEIAKFQELEAQIDLVTAAILQKNDALSVEGTTASQIIAREIELFEQLEEQIDLVTAAILQKNDAFGVEGTVVSGVVEGELIEIEKLQKALTGVADSIAALDTFFKELGENSSLSGFVDMIDKIKSAQDSLKAFAEILSKTQEQQEQAFKNANSVKQDRDETYSEDNSTVWSKTKATLDKDGEIQYEVKTSKEKQINKQVTTSQHYVPEKDEDGNLTGAMELLKTEITNDYDAARKDIDKLQNQIIKTDAIIDRLLDEKYRAKNHEEEVAIDKRLQLASTALTNQQNRLNDYYITTKQSYDSDLVQGFNERRKNTALERQSEIDKNNARILYRETEKTNKKIKEGRKRDKKNRESNDAFAIRQLGNLDRISDKYITNGDLPQKDVDALLEKYTEIIDKIAEIRHSTIVNPEAKEEISQMLKSYQQMAVIARDNQRIATTMQASDHKAAKASQNKDMATLLNNMKLSKADTSDLENRLQSLMKTFNESDDQSKLFFENIRNQFRGINSDFIKADKEQKSYEKVAAQYDNAINRFVKAQTAFDFGDQKDPVLLDNLNKAIEALDKAEKKYIEFRKLYLSDDSISNEEILRRTSRYINQMNKKNNPQDSAIYQGAKYKQQQKEDEDNARNQLFNEKVNTRLESLALLESQLEQSGKLTDELRAKINQLVDELSHVSYGNNSLSIYDEHLKQLKISLKETSQESESFKEHWDNVLSTINKMQSTELKNGMNAQTINARLGIGQGDLFAESHDNKGNWTGALADDANSYQIKFNDLLLNIREAISLQDELNSVLKVSFKSNNPEQYAEQIQQIETRISELIGKIRELGSGDLFNNLTEQQSAQYDAIDRKFERSMFETDQIRNNQAVKNTLDIIDNLKKARSEMNDLYVQRISYPDIEQTSLWKDAVENLTEVLLKAIEARDKLRQLNKQGKITDDQLSKVEESFESAQTEGSEKLKKQLDIANKAEYEGLLQVFKNLNKVTNEFYEGTAANLLWKGDDKDLIDLSPIIQKMQQLKIEAENATKALKEMLDAGKITNDEYNKGIDLSQTANYTQKSYSKMRKAEDSVRRKERSEYVSATKSELTDYANAMTGYKKLYGKQLTGNTLTTEEVAKMAEYLETIRTIEQGWNQDKTKGIDLSNKQASAEKQILDAMENRDDTDYTENILKQQADAEQAAKAYNKMQQQIEKMYKQADWRIDKDAWTEQVDSIQDKLNNIDLGAGYENVKKQILAIQQEAQKLSKDTDWQPLAKDWQSKQLADISKWMDQNKMAAKAFREELEQLKKDIGEVGSKGMAEEWNARFQKIVAESADKGLLGKSLGDRFKDQFKNTMTSLATYYLSFQDFIRYGRQAISIITELDTQLVEMAKVSQESMNTLKAYQLETFDIASQFGTTASQIQASTADWMRLGMLYAPLFMNNEKSPIIGRIL